MTDEVGTLQEAAAHVLVVNRGLPILVPDGRGTGMAETQQVLSVMQIHGGVPRVLTVTTMVPAKACQMPYRPPDVHKPTYLQSMRSEAALRLVMLLVM